MVIRIKFKHLLLVLGITLLLVFSALFFKGYAVYLLGRANELAGAADKAGVYYDRASETGSGNAAAVLAAKRKIELFLNKNNINFMMNVDLSGGSTMRNGAAVDYESITEINGKYGRLSAGAVKNDSLAEYALEVALMNYFAADAQRSLEILDSLDYISDKDLRSVRNLYAGIIRMRLGDMEEGYAAIKDDLTGTDRFTSIRKQIRQYYLFNTGDFEGFQRLEEDDAAWYGETKELERNPLVKPLLGIRNDVSGYREIVKKKLLKKKTGNTFTGRITADGKPMPYVLVYLKSAAYMNTSGSYLGTDFGVTGVTATDKDGYFRIDNVPDGTYGLGVSVEWSRVSGKTVLMDKGFDLKFTGSDALERDIRFLDTADMVKVQDLGGGKFRFDFNLPEGARYYAISAGELRKTADNVEVYNSTFYSDRIDGTSYVLDTAKELHDGMWAGMSYGTGGVDPYNWIEPFYHTADYGYCVTAYDEKGNILADSAGIYPVRKNKTLHVAGKEWNAADRLLMDGKVEEAIAEYEKQAEAGGEDGLHAAKVLVKLYSNGWIYNSKTTRLEGKDDSKAQQYLELLNGWIDNEYVKSIMADLFIKQGKYPEALDILEKITDTGGYLQYQIGRVQGYRGEFAKAEEAYKKFYEKTGNGADYLMLLYVLEGKDGLLREWSSRHNGNSYFADYEKAVKEYLKLDRNGYGRFHELFLAGEPQAAGEYLKTDDTDLGNFYKGLIELQRYHDYDAREKAYNGFYTKVSTPGLKELMKYFGKAAIQTGFGDY